MLCPDCGNEWPETDSAILCECPTCGLTLEDLEAAEAYLDDEHDQFRDDVEADADVLRMCGWGTDEDYGCYDDYEYPDSDYGYYD